MHPWGADPDVLKGLHKLPDAQILEKAWQEGRIVLMFDRDFGDLMATSTHKFPSVVIFWLRNETPTNVTVRLFEVIARRSRELEELMPAHDIIDNRNDTAV